MLDNSKMELDKKRRDCLEVAKLYYENQWSQNEIAENLKISRTTVSRLLQHARDVGLVKITIVNPYNDIQELSLSLQKKYNIKNIVIVPNEDLTADELLAKVGKYAANYLQSIVKDNDIIGLGWGKTIYQIANHLNPKDVKNIKVVQMKGSISNTPQRNYAFESVNEFANAFKTSAQYLPLPVIFDHEETKKLVEEDTHIKNIMTMAKKANIAVFTVGTVRNTALLFKLGYFTKEEQLRLQKESVGDVFSRFINSEGKIVDEKIDKRTIGIELDELRNKEHSILAASGIAKVPAIHGALIGGYANTLIIDQSCANQLLEY